MRIDEPEAALRELREAVRLAPQNARYTYVLDVALSEFGESIPDQAQPHQQ